MNRPRVVIVGAGFGGLALARALRDAPVDVLLIDQNNFHTFQPLLYQVATAGLEPEEIAHAVRGIFHGHEGFDFRLGRVVAGDLAARSLTLADGQAVAYDVLVLAVGAITNDFGIPGVLEHGFFLKSLTDALTLRSHLMSRFEAAASAQKPKEGELTFALVGGGPTGVELAGALVELIERVLAKDFPRLDLRLEGDERETSDGDNHPAAARVVLIERSDEILSPFHPTSRAYALDVLRSRGVEVWLGESVVEVTADRVRFASGRSLATRTLVWAAGVMGHPLPAALGLPIGRAGRVEVEPDLSIAAHPEIFVLGDAALAKDLSGKPLPQLAPVAQQAARHVAETIVRRLESRPSTGFEYRDPGVMATIGRHAAVTELPSGARLRGTLGWLAWLFLHLMQLVGFRNRLNVLINWAWNYLTYDRSARLILPSPPKTERDSQ